MPVKVGDIDLEVIRNNRELWFSEARDRRRRGESWWEFPEEIKVEQDDRQQVDPWEDLLRSSMLHGRKVYVTHDIEETVKWPEGWISSAEIMRDWLKLAPHQQGSNCGVRLGRVMRRLGFEAERRGKVRERGWVRKADASGAHDE